MTDQETAKRIVAQNVHANISGIVAELASQGDKLALNMLEHARECLTCEGRGTNDFHGDGCPDCGGEGCYRDEVYEHWIVSAWLALRLEEVGELVEHDLHGSTVWCRTTTSQSIAMDYAITRIVEEL